MSPLKTSILTLLILSAGLLHGVPTVFEKGDVVILGVNANNGTCGSSSAEELISFVCFKDLTNGTTLDFTDNGWERFYAGFWGTTEGVLRITRTGGTISAGTVITLLFDNNSVTGLSPDANWSATSLNGFSSFNMNTSGDQIHIMQGGTWSTGGMHLGSYTGGTVLFGLSTTGSWATFTGLNLGTQQSVIYPGMPCLSLAPTTSTDFCKYNGPMTATTQRIWLERIGDSVNWTDQLSCAIYNLNSPLYQAGYSIGIVPGGFREGYWLGFADDDWSDCANWESLVVPDSDTDVVIQALDGTVGPFVHPVIYDTGNECESLSIYSGGQLTINPAGALSVYEDILNNGTMNAAGPVTLTGNVGSTLAGASGLSFRTLNLNKAGGANVFTDTTLTINVNGFLNFTSGVVYPVSGDRVIFSSNAVAIGTSNASYVEGVVTKIGDEDFLFPVGDGFYQPIGIENIGSVGSEFEAEFIDANGPGVYGYNWDPALYNVATCSYWMLNRNSGTTARVRLTWGNDADCGITNTADLAVSRFDGSMWEDNGNLSTTGNAASGTILSFDIINSFSPFALASRSNDNPLPVEWLNFTTRLTTDNGVLLDWQTASETNNDYFAVEHSTNGFDFSELARISGAGNSNGLREYQWLHTKPQAGVNYYRLRQTDFDGSADYSPLRQVSVGGNWQAFVVGNQLELRTTQEARNLSIQLLDASGRMVANRMLGSGNSFEVPLGQLSRGIYFVQLIDGTSDSFRTRIVY